MARKRGEKPAAEQRTVGLFTGKTPEEEAEEAARMAADEDAKERDKTREPICLETQNSRLDQALSKRFESELEGFRLSRSKVQETVWYLEKLTHGGSTSVGVYLPEKCIPSLYNVLSQIMVELREKYGAK